MNKILQAYARNYLIENLNKCNEGEINKFKLMYSYKERSLSIEEVVRNMHVDTLDWAMMQVSTTLERKDIPVNIPEKPLTAKQLILKLKHGDPIEFERAVMLTVPYYISMTEAEIAINNYNQEWKEEGLC